MKNLNKKLQTFKKSREKNWGFTLIELLVVIVIIGILATIAVSTFSGYFAKARDAKRIHQVMQLKKALELYYVDHEEYPDLSISVPGGNPKMASNCKNRNSANTNINLKQLANWQELMNKLKKYPVSDLPFNEQKWPFCVYYIKDGYYGCPKNRHAKYVLIMATEKTKYPDLDLYFRQDEGGAEARYCIYSAN